MCTQNSINILWKKKLITYHSFWKIYKIELEINTIKRNKLNLMLACFEILGRKSVGYSLV